MFTWLKKKFKSTKEPSSSTLVEQLQKIANDANEQKRKEELERRNDRLEYIQGYIRKSAENGNFSYWDGDWPFGYYTSNEDHQNWIIDQLKSQGLKVKIDLKSHQLVVSWEENK